MQGKRLYLYWIACINLELFSLEVQEESTFIDPVLLLGPLLKSRLA